MRVINVIVTHKDCTIVSIDSFGVFEEQLSGEVVEPAENLFIQKAVENGINEDDADIGLEDGFVQSPNGETTISIVWSSI